MTAMRGTLPRMVDSALLGETAARCMETMDAVDCVDGGEIEAVTIIVIARNAEDSLTYAQVFSSEKKAWKQLGIIHAGLDAVETGERTSD